MWEPVVINNVNYLIRCKKETLLLLYITNFKEIWHGQLSWQDISNRFKELNPLFDYTHLSEDELVEQITSIITNISNDSSIVLVLETENSEIEFKCKLLESSIKFKFDLQKGDNIMYFNEFTLPLIQSVQYLETRQKNLFELLEKKDKEIQEHILENGEITRKSVITKKFDRNNVMDAVPKQLLVSVFGKSKQFFETFSQNYEVIKFNNSSGKKEGEPQRKRMKNSTR